MANFCLPEELLNRFKTALRDGSINPETMSEMSSAERRDFLKQFVGEEKAVDVNALFESKLLLKNQQAGMIRWAQKVAGMTPEAKRDIISKIEKMEEVLNPEDMQSFLEDLAGQRLGTEVTFDEAKTLGELSKKNAEMREKVKEDSPDGSTERLDYGASNVSLQDYINDLRLSNDKFSLEKTLGNLKKDPLSAVGRGFLQVASVAKSMKASLDDSAVLRQGWKTMFTHPQIWSKNALLTFSDIAKQLGKKATNNDVLNGIKADVYSRKNSMNGNYGKMKIDIGNMEEAYPSSLPQHVPLFGRLFKASETAYTGFLYRMRADLADTYLKIAEDGEVNLRDKAQLESMGNLINSLTGRGHLGAGDAKLHAINTVFFSPRLVKSSFDFLTAHQLQKDVTPFVRKQAAINLVKVAVGMATILTIAKALDPDSVEEDPTSSDFGKIKVGSTRFDVSGGMGSMIVLAFRFAEGQSKSPTTGKVTELNTGKYGGKTSGDMIYNYLENKLSPAASLVNDTLVRHRDFNFKKPTVSGEVQNLLMPLAASNAIEAYTDPEAANLLTIMIADGMGISTNSF
jgi:hypothetical protein